MYIFNDYSYLIFVSEFFLSSRVPPSVGAKGPQSRPLSAFSSSLISLSRPHELRLFCSRGFARAGPTVWRVAPHRRSAKACSTKCSKLQVSCPCYRHALLLLGLNNNSAILSDLLWKIPTSIVHIKGHRMNSWRHDMLWKQSQVRCPTGTALQFSLGPITFTQCVFPPFLIGSSLMTLFGRHFSVLISLLMVQLYSFLLHPERGSTKLSSSSCHAIT